MDILSTMDRMLDRLDAALDFITLQGDKTRSLAGEIEVNGVTIPMDVAVQLKELGVPLDRYSAGELRAAVRACAYDGRLIDDENGATFLDKLHLTSDEERKQNAEKEGGSFREKILKERAEKLQAAEEGIAQNPLQCGA